MVFSWKEIEISIFLFGCGFFLGFSLLELFKKEKNSLSLFFLTLNLFLIEYRFFLYLYEYSLNSPWIFFTILFNISILGPLLLSVSKNLLDYTLLTSNHPLYLHFLPSLPVLLGEFYFQIQDFTIKQKAFEQSYKFFSFDFIHLGVLYTILQLFIYLIFFIIKLHKINNTYKLEYSKPMSFILQYGLFLLLLFAIGFFLKEVIFFRFGLYGLTLLAFMLLYYREKYPGFFQTIKKEIQTVRYQKTQLNGINLEAIHQRLQELMLEQKLYRDEELRLSSLAEELLISPNQLSRILNERYNKNFNEFINYYRIEESKKLLLDDPQRTILSIAFEVGFNSKATFNSQFVRFTGMTPSEFRKQKK